jgi:hypothetical protein
MKKLSGTKKSKEVGPLKAPKPSNLTSFRVGEQVIVTGNGIFEIAEIVQIDDFIHLSNMIQTDYQLLPINSKYQVLPYDASLASFYEAENKIPSLFEEAKKLFRSKHSREQTLKVYNKLTRIIKILQ